MSYFLIADLTIRKYEIYHICGDEDLYHDFVEYLKSRTGNVIIGHIQDEPLINNSVSNADTKDVTYFDSYLQEFKIQYRK